MSISGFDRNRFKEIPADVEFDCIICTEIAFGPQQCEQCSKVFCQRCISDWMSKQKESQCPNRCDPKYKIGSFSDKKMEKIYYNLELKCLYCSMYQNIRYITEHEKECLIPKCQNFINCFKRMNQASSNQALTKMEICSPECQFFLNLLNYQNNPNNLYKEISSFLSKNYPNLDNSSSIPLSNPTSGLSSQPKIPTQVNPVVVPKPVERVLPIVQKLKNENQTVHYPQTVPHINLEWDPMACGTNVSVQSNKVLLEESAYIFRSALTKQSFSSGVHYWEIEPNSRSTNEMKIGVSLRKDFDFNTAFSDDKSGFSFYGIGQLRAGNNAAGNNYGVKIKNSGVVGMLLNMNKGELSFIINGTNYGVAFTDERLKKGPIYPAVSLLHLAGCTINYRNNIPNSN